MPTPSPSTLPTSSPYYIGEVGTAITLCMGCSESTSPVGRRTTAIADANIGAPPGIDDDDGEDTIEYLEAHFVEALEQGDVLDALAWTMGTCLNGTYSADTISVTSVEKIESPDDDDTRARIDFSFNIYNTQTMSPGGVEDMLKHVIKTLKTSLITGDFQAAWEKSIVEVFHPRVFSALTGKEVAALIATSSSIALIDKLSSVEEVTFKHYEKPSPLPTSNPTISALPTYEPTVKPSEVPTSGPSPRPSYHPSRVPTGVPTLKPSDFPTLPPSALPYPSPTPAPSAMPTTPKPSHGPSPRPTPRPTSSPVTYGPTTPQPSSSPSVSPAPSKPPTRTQTYNPTLPQPTLSPAPTSCPSTLIPTISSAPTITPAPSDTHVPTAPTRLPVPAPSYRPSSLPTPGPSGLPAPSPTYEPSQMPSGVPIPVPTPAPTAKPIVHPTMKPVTIHPTDGYIY